LLLTMNVLCSLQCYRNTSSRDSNVLKAMLLVVLLRRKLALVVQGIRCQLYHEIYKVLESNCINRFGLRKM